MSSKSKTTATKDAAKPLLVPQLRFPEFYGVALRSVQLGEVTEEGRRRNGKKHSAASVMGVTKADGIVPMEARIVAADIERYKLVEHDWFAYNPMRLNIGSIARWRGDSEILVSPDYVVFKCIAGDELGMMPGYLDQFRQSKAWEDFVNEGGDGGVRVRIYYKDISRLQLVLPSLPEQQKIANCLNSLDELIAAQARKVEALKTLKKGLIQQLFPREGETQPRLRFPEFHSAGEWKSRKAGTMFSNRVTKGEQGLPIYSVTIHDGMIKRDSFDRNFYDIEDAARNKKVGKGNIAYNMMRMWQGAVGVAPEDCLVSPAYIVLAPMKGAVPEFFQYLLKLPETLALLTSRSRGLTKDRLRLYYDDFASIQLRCPTQPEQQRIASCLSSVDAQINLEIQKLEALKTHKKGLMQRLFPSPGEVDA